MTRENDEQPPGRGGGRGRGGRGGGGEGGGHRKGGGGATEAEVPVAPGRI